jgi:hypothetical protein
MYINAKMIPVETVPGISGWGIELEEENSSKMYLIHCKNLCKCYNIPPPSTIEKEKKRLTHSNVHVNTF